jgi:hypothetical protein
MADTKISALPASTTPLAGTEVLPIVQGGATKQVSVANLTAGRAISATQLTLTTGNLIVASGQGVDFSATPGTGTSELFDDYEEGTYVPVVTAQVGSITSYTATATYTLIGRQVTVEAVIVLTNAGTGLGELQFTLPFAATASDGNGSGFENGNTGFQLSVFAGFTNNYASVRKYDATTIIVTNNIIRAGVTYFV